MHFNSAHPRKKRSVPYGLLIRCKRICTENRQFEEEATKIFNQLKIRKYPIQILDTVLTEVKALPRTDLLRSTVRMSGNKVRIITNLHTNNLKLTYLKDMRIYYYSP